MPLGRAGVRHRLHGLVLGRQRRGQLLGPGRERPGSAQRTRSRRAWHGLRYLVRHDTSAPHATPVDDSRLQCARRALTVDSLRLSTRGTQVPICEIDPWRTQYFESVACPDDVFIPTEDSDAWTWNPAHRWVYDKLAVAASQGLDAAPHGVGPADYPVFSKPIYNLKGMGVGSRVLRSAADYAAAYRPGHMWIDPARRRSRQQRRRRRRRRAALVAPCQRPGQRRRHLRSLGSARRRQRPRSRNGAAPGAAAISRATPAWSISRPSAGASSRSICASPISGPISTARAGSRRWSVSMRTGEWRFDDSQRRTGYSVVLFVPHGPRYRHPPPPCSGEIASLPGVSSVQITFHEDMAPGPPRHAARRLSRRDRQLLGSRRRQRRARTAAGPLRGGARLIA